MLTRRLLAVCTGLLLGACVESSAVTETKSGEFTYVHIAVAGDTVQTSAFVVDRQGRRTGWLDGRVLRDIPDCGHSYGSDEGIPDSPALDDTGAVIPGGDSPDSSAGPVKGAEVPRYHSFELRQPLRGRSLISDRVCELHVRPSLDGVVRVAAQAGRKMPEQCAQSVAKRVQRGTEYRWRVSWKAAGDSCALSVSELPARQSSDQH
jgi:hypothetical protein